MVNARAITCISVLYKVSGVNACSILRCFVISAGYILFVVMSTEEKLDSLIKSVEKLAEQQTANQRALDANQRTLDANQRAIDERLTKFEDDVTRAQEDATERAIKRARRERPMEFKKKGHQEQFSFNAEVADHVEAASRKIRKLSPAEEKEKKILEDALEELNQGTEAITERQKHILIADQSVHHWKVVEAYKRALLVGNDEEDKRWKAAEKAVEQDILRDSRQRATTMPRPRMMAPQPSPVPVAPQWPSIPPPGGQSSQIPMGGPPPQMFTRPVGPCFSCGMMGHLKRHCPKLRVQQYPFYCGIAKGGDMNVDNSVCAIHDRANIQSKICMGEESPQPTCSVNGRVPNPRPKIAPDLCKGGMQPIGDQLLEGNLVGPPAVSAQLADQELTSVQEATTTLSAMSAYEGVDEMSSLNDACQRESHVITEECVDSSTAVCTERQEPQGLGELDKEPDLENDLPSTYWEAEQGDSQITQVQGRLKDNISFWEDILKPAPWILGCIKEGYKLPLRQLPGRFSQPNQKSALENKEFVSQALEELQQNKCIVRVHERPYICSPLSVASNSQGKLRLVLNLRYLNQYLWVDKFKYEDLRTAMQLFQRGDYLFSFDLKSGYHHISIFEPHWKFLGLQWEECGEEQFFMFTVLPFGLATACYAFTKILRPLVKHWRSQGLRALLYLDDGIVAVEGEAAAVETSRKVREGLAKAGLVEHTAKCMWDPSQVMKWLGFTLDLSQGRIMVPTVKIEALKSCLLYALSKNSLTARVLASIVGKIISMSLAVGPVSRLMTRSMYALLSARRHWNQLLDVTPEARAELEFWCNQIDHVNGQEIWHSPSAVRLVYSDASDTGYGGFTVQHGCHIAQGTWSAEEMAQSSTWRELTAVRRVLESLIPKLKNQRIRWFSDNQNVVRILEVGSKKPCLQVEALAVFSIAARNLIRVEPEWIPRSENQQADYFSRIQESDDWMISPEAFAYVDSLWGPHTVDRFANNCNAQLARFNSRFWCPDTEAVDTFTCNWGEDVNWVCPPPFLILRTIRHAAETFAKGTIIVPSWPSAPFWPMLFPTFNKAAWFVRDMLVMPSEQVLLPGKQGNILPLCDLLAIAFDFSIGGPQ